MLPSSPYLSVIIPSGNRSLSYIPKGKVKVQLALDILVEQLSQADISSEILYVDWNHDPLQPHLSELISVSKVPASIRVKFIEIPDAIHKRYKNRHLRGIHNSVSLNVGLRRALGMFVVCKAQDTLFTPGIIQFIAERKLKPGTLYRCNRSDIDLEIEKLENGTVQERFQRCEKAITHTYLPRTEPEVMEGFTFPLLHTNASGDFQLLATEDFRRLRGYEETPCSVALHCDTTFAYCAHKAGIKEVRMPASCQIYKIPHQNIFLKRTQVYPPLFESAIDTVIPPRFRTRVKKIRNKLFGKERVYMQNVRFPSWEEYLKRVRSILETEDFPLLNGTDWGLGNLDLKIK